MNAVPSSSSTTAPAGGERRRGCERREHQAGALHAASISPSGAADCDKARLGSGGTNCQDRSRERSAAFRAELSRGLGTRQGPEGDDESARPSSHCRNAGHVVVGAGRLRQRRAGGDVPRRWASACSGVSLAFGLTVLTMAYAIGHISGCHLNPAVTIGLLSRRRLPGVRAVPYIVGQLAGAVVGAAIALRIASGNAGFDRRRRLRRQRLRRTLARRLLDARRRSSPKR